MLLRQLFDEESHTYTYLLADLQTREALLIDPVLGKVDRDLQLLSDLELRLVYVLDTHTHADHVTGSGTLRERTGAKVVASARGAECVDRPVAQADVITMGEVTITVLETPGHTDDSVSYLVGGHVFTGDALLVRSTGRTDFQNGDAATLYASITERLFALPPATVLWPAHDYRGHTQSTIGEEQRHNPRVAGKSGAEFKEIMDTLKLPRPKHLDVAVPANRECGLGVEAGGPSDQVGYRELAVPDALAFAASATLLDVREPHEFVGKLGHIPRAINIPTQDVLEASLDLALDAPLLVVCRSGRRSRAVCQALARRGFRNLANLSGGMLEYRRQEEAQ